MIRDFNFVIFLAVLQLAYLGCIVFFFPFRLYKYNVKLIVNEVSFTALMVCAVVHKRKGLSDGAAGILVYMIFFICALA